MVEIPNKPLREMSYEELSATRTGWETLLEDARSVHAAKDFLARIIERIDRIDGYLELQVHLEIGETGTVPGESPVYEPWG